ncbi:Ig-like domain-containing protein [Aquimarina litoralis]|uniref:Ig-like domain-containing protein n=1 Tax=Aquimarina litoralis TaxID=584605 RepID=UPI001C58B199|nr:Ig-like domain-containing protein [Aquimarina litoralis]MBW1296206.1 T9SS type A sorting domain-containing protein [Aquimarina litoralis]
MKKRRYISKNKRFYTFVIMMFLSVGIGNIFAHTPRKNTIKKVTSSYDCLPPLNLATIQPIQSGAWNQDSTWQNGIRPTSNDDVVVPEGMTLTLIGNCNARSIEVNGTLRAYNHQTQGTWFNLTTKYIMVMGQNALMEIGTKDQPYISAEGGVITLTGTNRNELIPGTPVNSKAIMVMGGATMNLHGNPKKSWVKIATQTPAGSTSITLTEDVDWEVGDQVVITPNRLNPEEAEVRSITNVSSNGRTISFAQGLQFPRMGQLQTYSNGTKTWTMDTRVEVGLLSRNLTIQGDNNTTDGNRYGAHVMIMNGSTGNADNVEFYRMGQGGTLGRYPWHWHLLGAAGNGQYITNCSIRKSYNRAITVHGTWGTLVDNNVAYDHRGHGIFLEDGSEINNVFSNNLVLLSKKPLEQDALLDSDFDFSEPQNVSPSAFWITNPDNSFIDNIVAGTEGTAYWFAFPDRPTGNSESLPALANLKPRETELKEFSGNSAHSSRSGFDINDALTQNHTLRKNVGFTVDNPFVIKDFTMFSNHINIYAGIGGGLENIIFENAMSSDARFHTMLATRATLQNSLFVSDTGNGLNTSNEQKSLNLLYDGALRMFDSHLVDWDKNDSSIFDNNGAGTKFINHQFKGITYNHAGPPRINIEHQWTPPNDNDHTCLQTWSNVIQDLDGSLTRTGVSSSLTSETDFYVFDDTYQLHNWDGLHSAPKSFALLRTSNDVPLTMTRKKVGCTISKVFSSSACGVGPYSNHHFTLDDAHDQFEHAIYYSSLSGNSMEVILNNDRQVGKAMTVRFKGFGNLNNVRIDGISQSNGINQVNNSNTTAYYVENNGDLYVKFILENKLLTTKYIVRWNSGSLPNLNQYNEEPNLMNAYVRTSNQSGCMARATVHIENNPTKTQVQVSLDGGQTYTQNFNDNVGTRSFNNVPVGTLIYARWAGQSCGQPIGMVKNNQENASCNNDLPDNTPPIVSFQSPNGNQFDEGSDLGVIVNASDNDGSIANVRLYMNDILVRQENGAPYEWGTANAGNEDALLLNLSAGNYTLRAVATDNNGASTTITKTIVVSGQNQSPIVTFISPTNTSFDVGENLGVVVNAVDSDGSITNVRLYINDEFVRQENVVPYEWGIANAGNEDPLLLNLSSGNYTLKAEARDNNGAMTTITKVIEVSEPNEPPTVTFTSPVNTTFEVGENLSVVVNAIDDEGISNVRLYINDILVRQENVTPYEWGAANPGQNDALLLNMAAGTYELKAVATNNAGITATITKNVQVIGNTVVHIRKRNAINFALDGGNGGVPNNNVFLYAANPNNVNQQWIEIDRGNGYYSYQKVNTDLCMDGGNNGALRQNIILWNCENNNQNQHWRKVKISGNMYRLEKRNSSGFSIDGDFGGANGRATYLWTNGNSNQNQHWIFEVLEEDKTPIEDEELRLYPNPVQNTLFISGNTAEKVVTVYDVLGAVKIKKELTEGENIISMEPFSAGLYLVKIIDYDNNSNTKTFKVAKK